MKVALVFAVCLVAVFARPEPPPNGERPEDRPEPNNGAGPPDLQRLVKDLQALLSQDDGPSDTDRGQGRTPPPRPDGAEPEGGDDRRPPPEGEDESGSQGQRPPPPPQDTTSTRVLKSLITLLSERTRGPRPAGGTGEPESSQADDGQHTGGCGGGQGGEPQGEGTGEAPSAPAGDREPQGDQEPPADAQGTGPAARELEIRALLSLLSEGGAGRPRPEGEPQGDGERPPPPPPQ